ncbi:MAG: leucine-rich repeat protein [Lachnospiraceae bacterium]|nr:leucine-rich repeat protein [Lachnospiraceae bacterium]
MITENVNTENGKIAYAKQADSIAIIEYSGRDLYVEIPELIYGLKVTVIKKKAFLSSRFVKEISIPNNIEKIEDYAFARCRNLEKITIPYKTLNLGQDILKDCNKLEYIYNGLEKIREEDDVAFLLAKTLNELDAFFLFDLENAGSEEWLKHLDATINMRMKRDEMEDFSKMILCGEEEVVCGEDGRIEDSNPEHYKSNRVKEKIRIAFLRLLHNYKIDKELNDLLNSYLISHAKGCETEETWKVVLEEHGDDKEYYDYLLSINAINSNNLPDILMDMGNRHTEMKSYLMKKSGDSGDYLDAFSDLEL